MVPRKGQYMHKDIPLLQQFFQVPIRFPKDFYGVAFKKGEDRAGEIPRRLRARGALPEDLI